jgi:hypothetical protein
MQPHKDIVDTFTLDALPNLDVVLLGALELFETVEMPQIDFEQFKRPLVVGSGNAAVTGKLLFDDVDAVFADESSYMAKLANIPSIDGAFLISASGGKHAIEIASVLAERNIPCELLTNNENAPAKELLPPSSVHVFPKNREPYTYNTSTYLGMILSKTSEDPKEIATFIQEQVVSLIPHNLASYDAFYLMVPDEFTEVREMFKTKFDELFGPKLMARVFTFEQTKHAKTVIQGNRELFVSFGVDNTTFGNPEHRLTIPLSQDADYGAMMAIGYYFIGQIQKQFPPYYKNRIVAYTKETSEAFGSIILPIVE